MQPISHMRRNQPNGAEWRADAQRQTQTIDRSPTGSTIHCLPRQAASSKQRRAKAQVHVHVHVRVEVEVEVEASRGRESITEGRGREGKWINRSEQVGVDDMTGIISMAKCGR